MGPRESSDSRLRKRANRLFAHCDALRFPVENTEGAEMPIRRLRPGVELATVAVFGKMREHVKCNVLLD